MSITSHASQEAAATRPASRAAPARPAYTCTVAASVAETGADDWRRVCHEADDPFMDLRYLEAIERSMGQDYPLFTLIVRDQQGQPAACACLTLFDIDAALFTKGAARLSAVLIRKVIPRWFKFRLILCGLPVSTGTSAIRFAPDADALAALRAIERTMRDLEIRYRAGATAVKEMTLGECAVTDELVTLGYLKTESLAMNRFEPRYGSFDEYCRALRSHYRYKFNRSKRKFERAGLRFEQVIGADEMVRTYTPQLHKLYEAVLEHAENRLEILPCAFFHELARRLEDKVVLTLVRDRERICGFSWGLRTRDAYRNLFIGVDYELNPRTDLYFNIMASALDYGLRQNVGEIHIGQTADTFKSRLGCRQDPRFVYIRVRSRLLNFGMRCAAWFLFPPPPRAPRRALFRDRHTARED